MAFSGFDKSTGPSNRPGPYNPFASLSSPPLNPNPSSSSDNKIPFPTAQPPLLHQKSPPDQQRPAMPSSWENQPKQSVSVPYINSSQRLSPVVDRSNSYYSGADNSIKHNTFIAVRGKTSPALPVHEDDTLGLYNHPNANARRLSTTPSSSSQLKEPVNLPSVNNQRLFPVVARENQHDAISNSWNNPDNFHVAKRTKSPPFPSLEDGDPKTYNHSGNGRRIDESSMQRRLSPATNSSVQNLGFSGEMVQRHDISPQTSGSQRDSSVYNANPSHQMTQLKTSSAETLSALLPASFNSPKRARSPPLQSADIISTSSSIQLDSEREIHAKAKRLARFNLELSQPVQTSNDLTRQKASSNNHHQAPLDEEKNRVGPAEASWNTMGVLSDHQGLGSSKVVVGHCPDMCPEPEREERERKGDLDKFERLDGERNQTTKFLAVKKYNRTAERDAELIRPLPVLQKTIDYLLDLLNQPYNENFLGVYNFLWDRMRAVRMDLRMQHIFNREAISMLEQMIRLHIVAMHELCEYKKGEGFTEGFDAHLNIEQMNKTSVELFQMYEDHRKRGKSVSNEKEFRGYYALLKLDKHPGYKVEPSELSLDLAKMIPEMRCTPEILFARSVARACRAGNFIAFFRLARKATYLQACLMHAHFAKVRTQALASLHSGLQNNQGIPVTHIVKWLGMEGEDVESLLEYHGFALREYEDLYMVKEGPFLNNDADYPTTCSQLVHHKKSRSIVDDVKFGPKILEGIEEKQIEPITKIAVLNEKTSQRVSWVSRVDEDMINIKNDSVSRVVSQPQLLAEPPLTFRSREDHKLADASLIILSCMADHEKAESLPVESDREVSESSLVEADREMAESSPVEASCLSEDGFLSDQDLYTGRKIVGFPGIIQDTSINGSASTNMVGNVAQGRVSSSSSLDIIVANPVPHRDIGVNMKNEASMLVSQGREEAFREKMKLILRKWKHRASVLREVRKQREELANIALSSLSLGPPVHQQSSVVHSTEEINFDYVARQRFCKLWKSWERLNVSELVMPILGMRNPDVKCVIWKLLFFAQEDDIESKTYNSALKWLRMKIMGSDMVTNDELLVSLPGLSIWKKWTDIQSSLSQVCCLSIFRETTGGDSGPLTGSSCLLYLASGSISWNIQRTQLHKLLMSIPSRASLPLLILCVDALDENITDPSVTIISRLGLHEADKTKISSFRVIFLNGRSHTEQVNSFFDDDQLKEGLQWLASHSPSQPILQSVNTHELVLRYLRQLSVVLGNLKAAEVSPNDCIWAFNEALDLAAEEINASASVNPNCWPSPEISLLDKSSYERLVSEMSVPCIGWSSPGTVESIIRAIKGCRLPSFPDDMSWLSQGSQSVMELEKQRLTIEECIVKYLTQSTQLLNFDLAVKEAAVMIQRGAGLEHQGSCRYIIPRWAVIFQRIYNWQLMRLRRSQFSEAYILAHKDGTSNSSVSLLESAHAGMNRVEIDFGLEGYHRPHSVQSDVSFDELLEMSCNIPFAKQPLKPSLVHGDSLLPEAHLSTNEDNDNPRSAEFTNDLSPTTPDKNEQRVSPAMIKSGSRFDLLMEECNKVQDKIDGQLFFYF